MSVPTEWLGSEPKACDICTKPIKDTFIDGATRMGPWGILCPSCHKSHGVGLGIGKGQKYVKQSSGPFAGRWLKIPSPTERLPRL